MMMSKYGRRTCVKVFNTCQHIHFSRSPQYYAERDEGLGFSGSYAINEIYVYLTDPRHNENHLDTFIQDLSRVSTRYYNLKSVHVIAPYAIMNGGMIEHIVNMNGTFSEIYLDVFGFHSPIQDMWIPITQKHVCLKKIRVTFGDGLAYPNSATEILQGLETYQYIKDIQLINDSPHDPVVNIKNKKLKQKISYVRGCKVMG